MLSGIITAANTATITANVSAMHNTPNLGSIIFIGFDLQVLLIGLIIMVIGAGCSLLVMSKLTSKDIVKDLRK